MTDSDKTMVTPRVSWFWVGYSEPVTGEPTMAFARGHSHSMLDAARFVLENIDGLRSVDAHVFWHGTGAVTERGLWSLRVSAIDVLNRAARELEEPLPHIVPLRTGNGIMYASGPEPDVWEWEELKRLAYRPLTGD
jgi:hypothetical protein